MPETPASSDAERPIGRFITEKVLPVWDEMNTFERLRVHSHAVPAALTRSRVRTHRFPEHWAAYLYNGKIAGGQYGRLTSLVSSQAAEACTSKWLTRQYMEAAGLPVPEYHSFSSDQRDDALVIVRQPGQDWVLRPDAARHGQGVTLHLTEEDFPEAWKQATEARPAGSDPTHQILLEPFHDALPLRIFVVGSRVAAAAVRVPLFVVGDGVSTVDQLLEASFAHRQQHVLLRRTLPEISAELLSRRAPRLSDVPADGTLHVLSDDGGLHRGGLPYDATDIVCEELKQLAVGAAESVPGLAAAAVDLLTPELSSAEGAVVLDTDAWASLLMHRYPAFGSPRPVALALAELIRLRAEHWERVTLPAAMAPSAGSGEDD
ncbi:hypothetical protein [Nesterenkonia sp.]|uniref:hypothetical protein n=1 Tax=Nesterenkonia sp. TaxID=704201 RepID=UPI002626EBCA|nr:hypothetical protein [Nesterenkonia sp.]